MRGFVALFVLLYAFEVQSQNCKDVADKWKYYNEVSDEDGEMFRFEDAGSVKNVTFDFEYLYYIMEDDSTLVILKQHMTKYEEETPSHQNSQPADVDVTFTCEDDVEILRQVQLGIRDSNNHDPEFVSADKTKIPTYEYLLPMPTPAKIPLAIFGDTIWARDIELSNTRMNFDIDPAGLTATLGIADLVGKVYEAVVTTDSVLDFEEKTFTITATDSDQTREPRRSTTATIIIRRDESTSIITPVFSEHYYTGIYYPEGKTVVAIDRLITVSKAERVEIVESEYEAYFNVTLIDETVIITSTTLIENDELDVIVFSLEASRDDGNKPGYTTVSLQYQRDPIAPAPKWGKSLYGGECDAESLAVNFLEEIKVTNAVGVIVQPEYDVYFDAKLVNGVVEIIALNPVKQAPWNDVVFTVSASGSVSLDTVIHLEIKRDSKPSVTLAPSPSEFKIDPPDSKDMEIYQFSATTTHPTDTIRFSLINPNNLPVFIHQQTGILSLTNAIISGRYAVTVVAEGTESGESDRRQISLVVSAAVICPNGEVNVLFSYLTKYATETEETTILDRADVSDSASSNLRYCINEVIPDDKGIFEITEDGDGNQILVATKELLREGNSVLRMDVPQYTLTVSVRKEKCDTPNSFINMVGGIYLPESIQNQPDSITITVLIDDVNNHEPEFDQDSIIICYPKKELAKTIRPQYLTKVHATDEDATTGKGYGIVHYTTTSENIYIDELSGIIYPTESIYENKIAEATISAQDGGGKSASQDMKLTIKLIEENKISVLSLRNVPLDELDETLEKLSASAQVDIRSLSASVVPFENSNRRAATDYYLDVYVYGIKNEEPVTTSELQSALEGVDIVSVNKFNAPSSNDDDSMTGYIVAVSLLSVLLFLVIVGGIAFWYFKLRDPYSNLHPYEEHITKTSTDTPPPSETFTHPRRATGYVFNDTDETKKDEDDIDGYESVRSAKSVDTSASPDDKERRKSVSFIPYIEKIQIEKTEDDEDEDEETTKV